MRGPCVRRTAEDWRRSETLHGKEPKELRSFPINHGQVRAVGKGRPRGRFDTRLSGCRTLLVPARRTRDIAKPVSLYSVRCNLREENSVVLSVLREWRYVWDGGIALSSEAAVLLPMPSMLCRR